MRPRELTLQGFRSYRERSTFDLRDRRLIGVVGPIGSGKSSLLDAIAFALYGKTPTFERDTRSLIHQLCDVAHVEFTFEVDGQIWRVQRGLRRKGQSGHKLERLSEDAPDADVLESVQLDRPVRERVEQLLGMGFDAFRRSVLLAQNRFAEFLRASDGQRNDVLKGVFGYERFDAAQTAAKDRARDAEGELAVLELEGDRLRRAGEERDAAVEAAERASERHARLDAAASKVEGHVAARTAAQRAAAEAGQRIDALRELTASLPPADELATVVRVAEEGGLELERLQAREAEAAEAAAAAEAELSQIAERVGDRASFTAFAELVARLDHEAVEAARAAAEAARAASTKDGLTAAAREAAIAAAAARELVATTEAALAEASEHTAQADAALHEARHAEMARELRRHLQAGAPCPVCTQVVVAPPRAAATAKVATAEKTLTRARRVEAEARAGVEEAGRRAAIATERTASASSAAAQAEQPFVEASDRARAAEAALAVTRSELVDRLGEGDPRELLLAREAELEAAESHLRDAARQLTEARAELDAERRTGLEAARALATLATKVAAAWGSLGEPHDMAPDAAGVRLAFVELGDAVIARNEEAEAERSASEEEARRAEASLVAELDALGLAADADFDAERRTAAAERAAADEHVRSLEATLAGAADLAGRIADATAQRDLARRLASDLQPSRFLAFLLAEERAALAVLGSVHLEELTGGAYRFTEDDTFRILDMNGGGAERSADSLSGGETFLASLALALALAEMVTRGGGRLDSFFLDEGFGSLDPEHLDRAMDGIGRLVAGDTDRLVVLVSHVEQMREVLEDLIVLDKDGRTGDTVVVSGASRDR